MTEERPPGDGEEPHEGDEMTVVGDAAKSALDLAAAKLAEGDARMVCGFAVVLADGVTPNGGVWFEADDDGPQEPRDRVAFLLQAVEAFAKRQGVPLAVMDVPEVGGQG